MSTYPKSSGSYITAPAPCCPKCKTDMAFEGEDWEGDPSEPGLTHRLSAYWFCPECDYTEQAERRGHPDE
jgi:hypothetical protein